MNKYLFSLIAALLFTSISFGVASNRVYYHIDILDEWGELITTATQVTVQNTSGTGVAVYSTKFGTTEVGSTGVITTGISDGKIEFWYADTAIDLTVTDGTRSYEIESFGVRDHRFMLPSFLTATSGHNMGQTDDIDFTFASWIIDGDTANRLDAIPDNDGGIFGIGDGTTQADVYIYSTSADYIFFDESTGILNLVDINIELDDDAYAKFGTDDDATLQFDGTNLELFAAAADTPFAIGGVTNGFDTTYYFETAGQFRTDFDGDFINLTDDMDLRFGTGASSDGDFMLSSNSSNLLQLDVVVAGTGEIEIGNDADDVPMKWYSETTGDYVYFTGDDLQIEDVSLCLGDGTQIQFGDALGTGDVTLSCTSNVFTIGQVVAGTGEVRLGVNDAGVDFTLFGDTALQKAWWDASADTWYYGADAEGVDVYFYADTTGDYMLWDENGNTTGTLIFEDSHIQMMDDTTMIFGDGSDVTLQYDEDGFDALQISGAVFGAKCVIDTDTSTPITVTAAESGKVFVSSYTGTLTWNLPQAAAGLTYTFIDNSATAADDVIVDIQAGDNIEGDTNGDGVICTDDVVGSSITLIAITSTRWIVVAKTGTWTAQ